MRSRTLPHLPGRCARCYQRTPFCVCAEVPVVETRTRFVVIRHFKEAPKSTGTARVAGLALPNLELRAWGERDVPLQTGDLDAPGTWLLFPGDAPTQSLPVEPPARVVVLDGTWQQAKSMVRRLPVLRTLPRLHLTPKVAAMYRLRQPPSADGMSTLEAIARVVDLLEGEEKGEALHRLHALWIERCMAGRGRPLDVETGLPHGVSAAMLRR